MRHYIKQNRQFVTQSEYWPSVYPVLPHIAGGKNCFVLFMDKRDKFLLGKRLGEIVTLDEVLC